MTVRTARIRIEDLSPLETLTEQEMAEISGAGRKGKWQFSGQSMEVLEVRQVMSAVTVAIDGNTAKVTGSSASDTVFVRQESGSAYIETASEHGLSRTSLPDSVKQLQFDLQLLFIGRTISESEVRDQIRSVSKKAHTAAVANDAKEFPTALAAANANFVYFRYLPPKGQMEDVHSAGKRAFIAGTTVSGSSPENWERAVDVGIDGILTDYPLELAAKLRHQAKNQDKQ